jgi:hypothetical protein
MNLVELPMFATGVGLARIAAADEAWCTKRGGGTVAQKTAATTWGAVAKVREKVLEAWHRFRAQRQ